MIITEEMLYKNLECELFNLIGREIPHFYKWWDESPLFIS